MSAARTSGRRRHRHSVTASFSATRRQAALGSLGCRTTVRARATSRAASTTSTRSALRRQTWPLSSEAGRVQAHRVASLLQGPPRNRLRPRLALLPQLGARAWTTRSTRSTPWSARQIAAVATSAPPSRSHSSDASEFVTSWRSASASRTLVVPVRALAISRRSSRSHRPMPTSTLRTRGATANSRHGLAAVASGARPQAAHKATLPTLPAALRPLAHDLASNSTATCTGATPSSAAWITTAAT